MHELRCETQVITRKAHTHYAHFCFACVSFPGIKLGMHWPRKVQNNELRYSKCLRYKDFTMFRPWIKLPVFCCQTFQKRHLIGLPSQRGVLGTFRKKPSEWSGHCDYGELFIRALHGFLILYVANPSQIWCIRSAVKRVVSWVLQRSTSIKVRLCKPQSF